LLPELCSLEFGTHPEAAKRLTQVQPSTEKNIFCPESTFYPLGVGRSKYINFLIKI
jgi:hypothetical protein